MLFNPSWSFHWVHEQKLRRRENREENNLSRRRRRKRRRCRGNHTSMTISCAMWKATTSHPPPSSAKTAVSGPKAPTSLRFIIRSSFWINLIHLLGSSLFWSVIGSDDLDLLLTHNDGNQNFYLIRWKRIQLWMILTLISI